MTDSTEENGEDSTDDFISLGIFSPAEAHRVLQGLELAKIECEIEHDDGITPEPSQFGNFGLDAKLEVFAEREKYELACQVRDLILFNGKPPTSESE